MTHVHRVIAIECSPLLSWYLCYCWVGLLPTVRRNVFGLFSLSGHRAGSRFAPSQWETPLQSNAVSHWLGANLESALWHIEPPNTHVSTLGWLISPWTNVHRSLRRHFQIHFHEWKVSYFYSNFTVVCSERFNWQYVSIGSSNGLAPNRRQAITCTNAQLVHRHIYAANRRD